MFSDATKSIVCLQVRDRTEMLTVWLCRNSRWQAAFASALEGKMSRKQLKQINTSLFCWKVPRKNCTVCKGEYCRAILVFPDCH